MKNSNIGSGLSNLGNTCFFNAVMQAMLNSEPLAVYLQQKVHSQSCRKKDWCIFCGVQRLWWESKKSRVVNPSEIVSNLKKIFKKDAHEFLRYLVEGMQEAETGVLAKGSDKNQARIRQTLMYKVFGGRLRTFVQCLDCNHKSLTCQRYYDFNIECQRSNSLMEGLQNYFMTDELMGANKYRCQNCRHLTNARKGFSILTLPKVLTFQFKRFTNSLRKIGKHVHFPIVLDLRGHLWEIRHNDPDFAKYELYAVTVHAGSTSYSGHYYSFIKHANQWYQVTPIQSQMNDSIVSRTDQQRVLNQKAYILFYKRVHTKNQQEEEHVNKIQEHLENSRVKGHTRQLQSNDKNMNNEVESHKQSNNKHNYEVNQAINHKSSHDSLRNINNDYDQVSSTDRVSSKHDKLINRVSSYQIGRKLHKYRQQTDLQETRQKLSMDIQKIKSDMKHDQNNNWEINNLPSFGKMLKSNLQKCQDDIQPNQQHIKNHKNNHHNCSQQIDKQSSLEVPCKLIKRRSKEQAIRNTSMAQLILRLADHISNLESKVPKRGGNRLLRPINRLRMSEACLTRKKIG